MQGGAGIVDRRAALHASGVVHSYGPHTARIKLLMDLEKAWFLFHNRAQRPTQGRQGLAGDRGHRPVHLGDGADGYLVFGASIHSQSFRFAIMVTGVFVPRRSH